MAEPSFSDHPLHVAWRIPTLLLLLSVLIVSGCEGRGEKTGQISIDNSFTTSGFGWVDGSLVYIFLKARENQGKVEVCAAYMPLKKNTGDTFEYNREVLAAASVTVNGVRVMHGLAFANPLAEMDDVFGQPATCARGAADWKPSYARGSVEVKIPRMRFVQ
jgi:hypothetical protein